MTRHRTRNPKFVKQYRDAAGNWIRQYRRGGKTIRLPNGRDLDDTFWTTYYDAERQFLAGDVRQVGATRTQPGSVEAALVACYRSTEFLQLAENSRRAFRQTLERDVRKDFGNARLAHLQPKHIVDMIADKAATSPSGARGLHAALRFFLRFCVTSELITRDPSLGIKAPKAKTSGWHTWTEAEIATYEAVHAIGSEARLAFALHLYTAQRSSDVVRLGRQHVGRDGMIRITQKKTDVSVSIAIHPALQQVLDAVPHDRLTFLINTKGRPIVSDYDKRWRRWCDEAGLPKECVPHGLRKAACRRLAEAGCSAHQIASISGHLTISETQRYTVDADRERLAHQAIAAITAKTGT